MSAPARHPATLAVLCLASLLAACTGSSPGDARPASAAAAAASDVTLEVTVLGSGTADGVVTSDVGGISCPGTCSATVPPGTIVTLTASAPEGTRFAAWGGICSDVDSGSPCIVAATPGLVISATFEAGTFATLGIAGGTPGLVTSTPAGIRCGATCTAVFPVGTIVTLTASEVPGTGATFVGWEGACSGTEPTCVLTMNDLQVTWPRWETLAHRETLAVKKHGAGRGMVSSEGGGIDCGMMCTGGFVEGTEITLTASAANGSYFVGWGGVCAGESPTCVVTKDATWQDVTATFETDAPAYTLTVSNDAAGNERAMVSSTTGQIDCGETCTERFAAGTVVTLWARTGVNATFLGWGGDCSGTDTTCVVPMSQDRAVTAAFAVGPTQRLVVETLGDGSIWAPEWYFACWSNSRCELEVPAGATVELVASGSNGWAFTGWSSDCTGIGPCALTMTQDHAVAASFVAPPPAFALTVSKQGVGSGRVTSYPAAIDCGEGCSAMFLADEVVTLTAAASSGSSFAGWMGACSGASPTCAVVMSEARTVTAVFTASTSTGYTLSVAVAGTGAGSVASTTVGINCGASCSATVTSGTVVTLTAARASADSAFVGWSGACTGTGACVVTMTEAQTVTATFAMSASSGGCQVTYRVLRQSHGHFTAALDIRNTGATAWNGWTVAWSWPTDHQRITHAWNAIASRSGQAVTLRNTRDNGQVAAGATHAGVRFDGKWKGSNPPPVSFSVNGVPCH
jgi:hypothetical protein